MRIEQLRQFCEYVKTKSLTAGSQKLFLTPQALHVSMKRLEEELDAKLVEKSSSGVLLTESGQCFLQFAEKVLAEYDALVNDLEELKNSQKNLKGKLFVYSNMLFQRNVLPHVIKKFSSLFPEVQLFLFESDVTKIYKEFNEFPPEPGTGRLGFVQCPQPKRKLERIWHEAGYYQFHKLCNGFFIHALVQILKSILQYQSRSY